MSSIHHRTSVLRDYLEALELLGLWVQPAALEGKLPHPVQAPYWQDTPETSIGTRWAHVDNGDEMIECVLTHQIGVLL